MLQFTSELEPINTKEQTVTSCFQDTQCTSGCCYQDQCQATENLCAERRKQMYEDILKQMQ